MKKLILLFTFIFAACVSASAAPVALTPAEEASFSFILGTFTPAGTPPVSTANLGAGNYSVQWAVNADGLAVTQSSVLNIAGGRGVAGDTFSLTVVNNNGNPWNFSVAINAGAVGAQSQGPFLVTNNGGSHTFSFVLAAPLTSVTLTVGQNLPIAGNDRGAEYHIGSQAIPEPASMFLLGTGLMGLAGMAKRRFGKKEE